MNRFSNLTLGICLFGLVQAPKEWTDYSRSLVATSVAPLWRSVLSKEKKDNRSLCLQTNLLHEWIQEEQKLQELAKSLALLAALPLERRANLERQANLFTLRYNAKAAPVIFRDPSSWSSSLWISFGREDNEVLGKEAIGENSPVLSKGAVIGMVEYVGSTTSRVRLISDAGLVPAVRALRGGLQNRELSEQVEWLQKQLSHRSDLFASSEEQQRFLELLTALQERIDPFAKEERLAKGELHGSSEPLWRSRGALLKGIGFNYDYADHEGPPRDLRTGRCYTTKNTTPTPLLREGDLLITSGLDGVFPEGLPIALVTRIAPLEEGSYSYELEARPAAGDLFDLQTVWVLPPVGSEGLGGIR